MELRCLTPADAEVYRELRLAGLKESPGSFGSTYEEELPLSPDETASRLVCSDEKFVVGAFEAGELLGMAGFMRSNRIKTRHKGFVLGMYVAPPARGRGIGKALLTSLVERVRTLDGVEQIILEVTSDSGVARALYLAHGFERFGLERNAMKQGQHYWDSELMILRLGAVH